MPVIVPELETDLAGGKPRFDAPVLHKFTDMQELLLLDPIHEVTKPAGLTHPIKLKPPGERSDMAHGAGESLAQQFFAAAYEAFQQAAQAAEQGVVCDYLIGGCLVRLRLASRGAAAIDDASASASRRLTQWRRAEADHLFMGQRFNSRARAISFLVTERSSTQPWNIHLSRRAAAHGF